MKRIIFILFCTFISFGFFTTSFKEIPKGVMAKVEKAIASIYGSDKLNITTIELPGEVLEEFDLDLNNERLLIVKDDNSTLGYIYVGEALSMKNVFDYAIFFDINMTIKKSKVLIYRENYGRQIGSQRWLKQFIGKKIGDPIEYGQDIDAIVGATISASSMTRATDNVLKTMKLLKDKNLINF
jgi:Na+-translocating ferredoxin:NAD+ oxidoreductase RnfG subunit